MNNERPTITVFDKQAAHRSRFELGQRMVEILNNRTLEEIRALSFDSTSELGKTRLLLWKAESDALYLDPELRCVPGGFPERHIES